MAFCYETCSFQVSIVQEASGGGGGVGGANKKQNSLASTRIFFVFGAPAAIPGATP